VAGDSLLRSENGNWNLIRFETFKGMIRKVHFLDSLLKEMFIAKIARKFKNFSRCADFPYIPPNFRLSASKKTKLFPKTDARKSKFVYVLQKQNS
jgi:hypothetical protein